jgi:ATP synthase F1 gamma subunit
MQRKNKLRKDMDFNKLIGSVLEALKGVASAEYFRLQSERKDFTDFEECLKGFLENISLGDLSHPFLDVSSGPKNIVIITSDASFLGRLNMAVVSSAFEQYSQGDLLTVVGRKGVRYVEEFSKDFTFFKGIDDHIPYEKMVELRDYIIKTHIKKRLAGTLVVFPHFVSFAVQTIQQLRLFPCRFLFPQGSESESSETEKQKFWQIDPDEEVIVEPSKKETVEYLIKIWLTRSIHQIFWESKLSEWAARIMHLDKSVDEAKRQGRTLRMEYFRVLHQISDQNIREIFSNRLVLSKESRSKDIGVKG